MKSVVSVSIGSSARDHHVQLKLKGQEFYIWRQSTDGNMKKAVELIRQYDRDSETSAIGLGGIGLRVDAADRVYYYRDGRRFGEAAQKTPIVCGAGLKGIVEGDVPRYMADDRGLAVRGKKVGVVSAFDRWGLSMGFERLGCDMTYGDLTFGLGIPRLVRTHEDLVRMVHLVGPAAMQLPFKLLYPTTSDHKTKAKMPSPIIRQFYEENDIIAGDYKFIKQYMPADMSGKWVVTNTTTMEDVEIMRKAGVEILVTTTPRLDGRTFGTNVIEATLLALDGASEALPGVRYLELLHEVGWWPDVIWLQGH
jgi:hypothetical protein